MNILSTYAHAWAAAATGETSHKTIQIECKRQPWMRLRHGCAVMGTPMGLNGKTYSNGLGTHADSEIEIRAGSPMTRLKATVGMERHPDPLAKPTIARVRFAVSAGGRELWHSRELGPEDTPDTVDLALPPDVRVLTLTAIAACNYNKHANVDWAGLTVTLADGEEVALGRPEPSSERPLPLAAPFDFKYGGKPVSPLLHDWNMDRAASVAMPDNVTQRCVTWRDPASGLACMLELREFADFQAVEWVLRLRNDGTVDTPIIEDIQSMSAAWAGSEDSTLHRSRGSLCRIDDFEYLSEPFTPETTIRMAAGGGRSSSDWLPFFNLQTGNLGVITAIGWTGQWSAEFAQESGRWVTMRAGIEQTHLRLHPGEEIRTPRMLMLFWEGDRMAAHNTFRQFILKHHTPRPGGQPLTGPLTIAHWGGMKTPDHLARISAYAREKLDYDYYWIDAGWYGPADSYSPDEFRGDWAKHVGNWTVNPVAHPQGLRPISDAACAAGMKFLLWFEPERAVSGTPLTLEHPEWFLGKPMPLANLLFNLGNPEARRWLTEYIAGLIQEHGVHLYRQDFNFEPLPYWRANDAPDRRGMTEIRHVEGLYAFWDELLRRFPGLVIDNCASGGRRIDLETISRSIPLWRSDWQCWPNNSPIGGQVHGMGLSYWVPLHGTGSWGSRADEKKDPTYRVRSNYGPAFQFTAFPYEYTPMRADYPWDWHRARLAEYHRARPLFTGDYYPLTANTSAVDQWAAYQMHRRDTGEGMLVAFRRQDSPFVSADFRLHGLDSAKGYELEDVDNGHTWRQTGKELLEQGVRLTMETVPTSRLVFYRSVQI